MIHSQRNCTGSWSYGVEGGSITWNVGNDGVLTIEFDGGEFEEYTLTSGTSLSGTVNIDFSNEPTLTASWEKVADTATDQTTLLSGRTFYTTVSGQYGTLESWSFNEAVTQMTYEELIDTDGELSAGIVDVVSVVDMVLTFDDPEEGGEVVIPISELHQTI